MTAPKSDRDLIAEIAQQQKIDPALLLGPSPSPPDGGPISHLQKQQSDLKAMASMATWQEVVKQQDELLTFAIAKWRETQRHLEDVGALVASLNPLIVEVLASLYADDTAALRPDIIAFQRKAGIANPEGNSVVPLPDMLRLAIARADHLQKHGPRKRV